MASELLAAPFADEAVFATAFDFDEVEFGIAALDDGWLLLVEFLAGEFLPTEFLPTELLVVDADLLTALLAEAVLLERPLPADVAFNATVVLRLDAALLRPDVLPPVDFWEVAAFATAAGPALILALDPFAVVGFVAESRLAVTFAAERLLWEAVLARPRPADVALPNAPLPTERLLLDALADVTLPEDLLFAVVVRVDAISLVPPNMLKRFRH